MDLRRCCCHFLLRFLIPSAIPPSFSRGPTFIAPNFAQPLPPEARPLPSGTVYILEAHLTTPSPETNTCKAPGTGPVCHGCVRRGPFFPYSPHHPRCYYLNVEDPFKVPPLPSANLRAEFTLVMVMCLLQISLSFFFIFLGPLPRRMEVPSPWVE